MNFLKLLIPFAFILYQVAVNGQPGPPGLPACPEQSQAACKCNNPVPNALACLAHLNASLCAMAYTNPPQAYMCTTNKMCIHISWIMDGKWDCPNGEDETVLISFVRVTTCVENVFIQTPTAGNIKGKIVDANGKKYSVFLGIPYAKPPVGDLSFKDPVPLDPKSAATVVDASNDFSKTCIQTFYSANGQSEDCLYLNVLSPKVEASDNTKYPVMVWIHGGGFIIGSASQYPVNGTLRNIVSRGVVFVSMNYRLGTFGFFTTQSSVAPGNYGLLDQLESLKWVKKNIEFFGGDPAKVTIFGESAGSASVSFLTISPLAQGLFNQAIMMSGSSVAPWSLMYDADPNDPSGKLLESVGCRQNAINKPVPKCPYSSALSSSPTASDLQRQQREVDCLRTKFNDITSQKPTGMMAPRVDGRYIPQFPEILIKNRSPYNILIGNTNLEYPLFSFGGLPGFGLGMIQSKDEFYSDSFFISCKNFKCPLLVNSTAHKHYENTVAFASSGLDEKSFWFQQDAVMNSDLMFVLPVYQDALNALKTKSNVYLYSWDYKDAIELYDQKSNFYWKGPSHMSELFYLFDTDDLGLKRDINPSRRDKSQDSRAAEILGKLWTNFAKFGNPTPTPDSSLNSVTWQKLSETDLNFLSIEVPNVQMKNNFHKNDTDFWNSVMLQLEACG